MSGIVDVNGVPMHSCLAHLENCFSFSFFLEKSLKRPCSSDLCNALGNTWIVCPQGCDWSSNVSDWTQTERHELVVHDVMVSMLRVSPGGRSDNVLCRNVYLQNGVALVFYGTNTASFLLETEPQWIALHEHIGTEAFRYLLLHTLVFVPIKQGLFQLCGTPFCSLVKKPTVPLLVNRKQFLYCMSSPSFPRQPLAIDQIGFARSVKTRPIRSILETIHRRIQSFNFEFYLTKHCSYGTASLFSDLPFESLLLLETDREKAFDFIWSCLKRLLPLQQMCGDKAAGNVLILRRMVHAFMVDLGVQEQFHLPRWMDGFRHGQCTFWIPKTRYPEQWQKHQRMATQLIAWLFRSIVIPLIQRHFYATEMQGSSRVHYYRTNLWKSIVKRHVQVLVEENVLSVADAMTTTVLRARLLPKGNGKVRFLANHKRTNDLVKNALLALSYEASRNEQLLHGSYLNVRQAYDALAKVLTRTRDAPNVYMIAFDFENAFDSMLHDELKIIVEQALTQESYTMRHYAKTTEQFGTLWTKYDSIVSDLPVYNSVDPTRNSVIVDYAAKHTVSRRDVLETIYRSIDDNYVSFSNRAFRQEIGIAQGSSLSPILCAAYFAKVQRIHFEEATLSGAFVRFFDDNLYLTTGLKSAERFLKKLIVGATEMIAQYNVGVNASKTFFNFDTEKLIAAMIRPRCTSYIPWCGLLIDCQTRECFADFERHASSVSMQEKTVIPYGPHMGVAFSRKMLMYVSARCWPILFDDRVNSTMAVSINVYQLFLWTAIRFHCIAQQLAFQNDDFLWQVVMDTIHHGTPLLNAPCQTRVLALSAFKTILDRKHTHYGYVLGQLRLAKKQCNVDLDTRRAMEKHRHSVLLEKLKF